MSRQGGLFKLPNRAEMPSLAEIVVPQWQVPENILAYTSTRLGGVSHGDYGSNNVGDHVGDKASAVAINRANLPAANHITWLKQVHGNHVVTLPSETTEGDAAFTAQQGQCCAVMTADCVPILICDEAGTQVAAVHAGWKGLSLNIISKTIAHFSSPPTRLQAWVGPAICQQCYEVNEKLADTFAGFPNAIEKGKSDDKFQLNLPLIAETQLRSLNIGQVVQSNLCTYCDADRFYSHRRATHQGKQATGRIVSVIGLR